MTVSLRNAGGVNKTFSRFDLSGTVHLVTGGGQGLGLAMAEGLAEAGGRVYCLDRCSEPSQHFQAAQERLLPYNGGRLFYKRVDITDTADLDKAITTIADEWGRLDGVIAAAGIQQITPAVDYTIDDAEKMLRVNFLGVLMTATSAARQMMKYKNQGAICLVASMSGMIANKGLISPVYNASKASVIQLARSLSMEWSKMQPDGGGGIRVNCLSPGHVVTPMVRKNFEEVEGLRQTWEAENMMGRISEPEEFKGAALFLLSKASSFMTGNNLVVDGGHTAW
ncbi:NAD(P)-binding protein [Teratosphaeria nubilosa]|uniref:NAD(P)-binding protein n=1 Tax=Teratosphaeria nubilosa TaxID=161662 RepID=A0A6G1LB89_9PEZI|nr:NAD(P)-binding protein [Teratosphaeria nubilosa]